MQVRSYLGTCSQTLELVQPSEGPLDDPADLAEPGAMRGASAGNHRGDPLFAKQVSVLVVVVASVGEQPAGPIPRPAPPASKPAPVRTAATGGAWKVQLGAFRSRANAETQWTRVRAKLGGASPAYVASGGGQEGMVGLAPSLLVDARPMLAFAVRWLEAHAGAIR